MDVSNIALVKFFLSSNVERGAIISYGAQRVQPHGRFRPTRLGFRHEISRAELSRWIFSFAAISIIAGYQLALVHRLLQSRHCYALLRCTCARVNRNGRRTRSTYPRAERIESSFFSLFFPFSLYRPCYSLTSCINGRWNGITEEHN